MFQLLRLHWPSYMCTAANASTALPCQYGPTHMCIFIWCTQRLPQISLILEQLQLKSDSISMALVACFPPSILLSGRSWASSRHLFRVSGWVSTDTRRLKVCDIVALLMSNMADCYLNESSQSSEHLPTDACRWDKSTHKQRHVNTLDNVPQHQHQYSVETAHFIYLFI